MITQPKTPGVYIDEVDAFGASVVEVETAIPAFIGYTYLDIVGEPKVERIESLGDFEKLFGKPDHSSVVTKVKVEKVGAAFTATVEATPPKDIFYYALKSFYANGGGVCYISSAGKAGGGLDAEAIKKAIDKIKDYDEPTLLVVPESVYLVKYPAPPVPPAPAGDIDPDGYKAVMQQCITQAEELKDRFVILDVPYHATDPSITKDALLFRDPKIGLRSKYAASYYPYLKTVYQYEVNLATIKYSDDSADDYKGLAVNAKKGSAGYEAAVSAIQSKTKVILPPSATVAGIYALVDNTRGVWKAPANVLVKDVSGTTIPISFQQQESLNVDADGGRSINAIKFVTGVGLTVWGARTMDSNSRDWRFVNVRRFFNMVEESVYKATLSTVFEPNNKNTWVKVKSMIESYLLTKWIEGALAGSKPDEAFYVKVGLPETMTSEEILDGIMRIRIGMAVTRPAEFIILEFTQKKQTS